MCGESKSESISVSSSPHKQTTSMFWIRNADHVGTLTVLFDAFKLAVLLY